MSVGCLWRFVRGLFGLDRWMVRLYTVSSICLFCIFRLIFEGELLQKLLQLRGNGFGGSGLKWGNNSSLSSLLPDHSLVCGENPVCHSDCWRLFHFCLHSDPQTWFQCKARGNGNGSYRSLLEWEMLRYYESSRIVESFTLSRACSSESERQEDNPTNRGRVHELNSLTFIHQNPLVKLNMSFITNWIT